MKRWAARGLESKNPWMEGIGPRLNAIIHRPDTFLAPTQRASLSAFPRQRSPRHSQAVAPQILQNTDINRLITRLALGVDIYAWKKAGARAEEGGWEGRKGNRDRSGMEEVARWKFGETPTRSRFEGEYKQRLTTRRADIVNCKNYTLLVGYRPLPVVGLERVIGESRSL